MRILAVADNVHRRLYDHFDPACCAGVDVIVSCGDLPADYLGFLVSMLNVPLLYVRGNHDTAYAQRPPEGCIDLSGRMLTIGGVRFAGLEGCRPYTRPQDAIQYTEREMWRMAVRLGVKLWLRRGVDVLVTHAPPYGIHNGDDNAHTGYRSYNWLIEKFKPKVYLHGHQHMNYRAFQPRRTQVGGTEVINADGYQIVEV